MTPPDRSSQGVRLTDTDLRMLALLTASPERPGWMGQAIWGDPNTKGHRMPQHYARPAGRVLRKLERLGLAAYRVAPNALEQDGWVITAKGQSAAEAGKESRTHGQR